MPLTPDARFAAIIDLLCRTVAASIAGGRLSGPFIVLIWRRLRRIGTRFAALSARLTAGTLAPPRRRPAAPRPSRPRPPSVLPRGRAWLLRLVPQTVGGASQLQHLLTDPEMTALIAAAPQAGRILRPLCRMLGIRPPAALALPPPRARRVTPGRPGGGTAPPPAPPDPGPAAPPAPRACGPPVAAT